MDSGLMEPNAASREERQTQPPALPVKQRRSQYSRGSSVDLDSDGSVFSPLGPQHQNFTYTDVFSEPIDCNAAQCPIHQRYDTSHCHQERFFSDGTPPPVPKKRLARTLSLPGAHMSSSSPLFLPMPPLSPQQLHSYPHNFDNPVYMLAPIADTHDKEEAKPLRRSQVPSLPLSQLSFDTPDEQLAYLFSSFSDQGLVSQGIQHRHLLFLRSMAQSVEARILLQGEASVSSYQPQDFLLCEGYTPKQIGDALYYSLHSPKFPTRVLSARVQIWANSALASPQPSHVNIQEVIVSFPLDSTLKNESTMLKSQDSMSVSAPSQSHSAPPKPPCEGSIGLNKSQADPRNVISPTVSSLLHKGYSVSIERDLPHATLEDFMQDSRLLQRSNPSLYERQLCVLLLQLAMGFQHLCNKTATCIELMPQYIFLVWPRRKRGEKTKGEVIEEKENNAAEKGEAARGINAGQTEKSNRMKEETEWEERRKEGLQMLWRTWGSPRVVLAHQPSYLSPSNPSSSINTQLGALLLYCLQPRVSLTSHSQGSTATLSDSPYTTGLLHLASLLQDENSRLQIADTVAILQALLWGPRAQLFKLNCPGSTTTTVQSWLIIKRALLMMKLAERGLVEDQSVLDWEDCLCLQYLSVSDSETVTRATEWLGHILN